MSIECCICRKGPTHGVTVHRINPKGVKGIWACEKHIRQTDAPPIDHDVKVICDLIGGKP